MTNHLSLNNTMRQIHKLMRTSAKNATFVIAPGIAPTDPFHMVLLRPTIGFTNLSQALNTFYTIAIFGGALMLLLQLVLASLRYITAGESSENTAAARRRASNAIVGIMLLALVLVAFRILVKMVPGLDQVFQFS